MLVSALSTSIPVSLAQDLVDSFLQIRQDVATSTLGRSAPGKFVESVVQTLQVLTVGKHDAKPNVDEFLRTIESSGSGLDDGLRLCAARICRAMYSLRSKRNIVHKGAVDPNTYDLQFLLAGAQWTVAELLRSSAGISMEEAGRLVKGITSPVGGIIEDFGGKRLVHGAHTIRKEALVLLQSYYPQMVFPNQISHDLDRRSASAIRNELRAMWRAKLVQGDRLEGYQLTKAGLAAAIEIIQVELNA